MSNRTGRIVLASIAAFVASSHPAGAWRLSTPGNGNALLLDASGDVVAGGRLRLGLSGTFAVLRVGGSTGSEVWRYQTPYGEVESLALDAAGNVIAGGTIGSDAAVIKIDGTGAEIWRRLASGNGGGAGQSVVAVATDGGGDVYAGALLVDHGPGIHQPYADVSRLDGVDGSVRWRQPFAVLGEVAEIAVDAAGNPVVAGGGLFGLKLAKLASSDGLPIWQYEGAGGFLEPGRCDAVALHPSGDVIALCTLDGAAHVVRLDGTTGAEHWRHPLATHGTAVAVDSSGDVVALGHTTLTPDSELVVAKVDEGGGAELWRAEIPGGLASEWAYAPGSDTIVLAATELTPPSGSDSAVIELSGVDGTLLWERRWSVGEGADGANSASAVAVDVAGAVFAAGTVGATGPSQQFRVMKLAGSDGGAGLLSGRRLVVTDNAADPSARRIVLASNDSFAELPPPTAPSDPTLHGAALRLDNPTTGEAAQFTLPSTHWRATAVGYRYADPDGENGPCHRVDLRDGRLRLRCRARDAAIPFSLDEPSQGSLVASFRLGSGSALCFGFGGAIIRDKGTAIRGPRGRFSALDSGPAGMPCAP